jgi:multicomponent Na+:H+ antiporter subunit A
MTALEFFPYLLISLFAAGLGAPLLVKWVKYREGLILSIIPLLFFALFLHANLLISDQEVVVLKSAWGLVKGAAFSFRLDGLSLLFGLLISGIGILVLVYSSTYMKGHPSTGRFFMLLTLFMAAMLGLVFSENLIVLFVFWELTSVISFLLIGFDNHLAKARKAALQAFLLTGLGGLALLFAILLVGDIAGTFQISELLNQRTLIIEHSYYPLIFLLVALSVFTKSAQFPLHFWLPGAMNAPTPVSAYLHSATMVNAGVFLLLRVNPFLGDTWLWQIIFPLAGSATMLVGALLSFGEYDLKRILAFTTISALGMMVLLIGLDTDDSIKATLVFFVVHGLYKGALFMIAGYVDKLTGTRDIRVLGRLWKPMGMVAWASVLALLSMAGLPPMLGFVGKELIYGAKVDALYLGEVTLVLGMLANAIMVGISIYLLYHLFWPKKGLEKECVIHEKYQKASQLKLGPVLLAALSLILGLMPDKLSHYLTNALYFIRSTEMDIHLSLWHGFNFVFALSVLTVLMGIVIFLNRQRVVKHVGRLVGFLNKNLYLPDVFENGLQYYVKLASSYTDRIQHGYHRYYLKTFFLITVMLVTVGMVYLAGAEFDLDISKVKWHIVTLLVIMGFGAFLAVVSNSRISAILALGVVGFGIGLLYLFYGAVDLAITQFLVETLIMVIFVLVIYYLPRFAVLSTASSRWRDVLIAALVGVFVTVVVLKARFINLNEPISDFFKENSLSLAHGRNIVNVILVDFRALDTLGEITVLALAAGGVVALLRSHKENNKRKKA